MDNTPHDEHSSQPQKPQRDYGAIIRPLFIAAVIAAAAGSIIYLKNATSGPLSPQPTSGKDQLVAHPDTTTSDEARKDINTTEKAAPTTAAPAPQPNDSIDHRSPYNAGYEDGYNTGYLDGSTGDWEASYDETPRPSDRDGADTTYRGAYQIGYAAGFEDGKNGKTFSIIGGSNDTPDEDDPENYEEQGESKE